MPLLLASTPLRPALKSSLSIIGAATVGVLGMLVGGVEPAGGVGDEAGVDELPPEQAEINVAIETTMMVRVNEVIFIIGVPYTT